MNWHKKWGIKRVWQDYGENREEKECKRKREELEMLVCSQKEEILNKEDEIVWQGKIMQNLKEQKMKMQKQ